MTALKRRGGHRCGGRGTTGSRNAAHLRHRRWAQNSERLLSNETLQGSFRVGQISGADTGQNVRRYNLKRSGEAARGVAGGCNRRDASVRHRQRVLFSPRSPAACGGSGAGGRVQMWEGDVNVAGRGVMTCGGGGGARGGDVCWASGGRCVGRSRGRRVVAISERIQSEARRRWADVVAIFTCVTALR